MKKMIVKNWKRIAAVVMAVILVVGSVNLSGISANAEEGDDAPNAVGGLSLNDFSLYQFLTYYQYVIKGDATIGNHTVGSMLIGGEGTIGAFGEGAIAPVYIRNLQGSGNYAERRYDELVDYYPGKVPAYYGKGSATPAAGWEEYDGEFINFESAFNRIEAESRAIVDRSTVTVGYNGNEFTITGSNAGAIEVVSDEWMQGKYGNILTIDFSKFSGNKNITITNEAFQKLVAIDIRVNNIDDFNEAHNISILGDSVNVSYAYNPAMGTHPSIGDGAVCVTINGATFQGGALKSMTGNKQAGQLLDAPMELLWNFPDAETASVEYLGGHVVAPKATVTIYGGNFEGGVIAKELINTSAEGHMYPYNGIPKNFNDKPVEESLKINVPIYIEKTFGSSDFSNVNERSSVLQKTYFAVFHDNNGYVQTIRYNQDNDTYSGTVNKARYSGEFTFTAEKGETYYFYVAEVKTDTDRYEICKLCWAIRVEVDSSGTSTTTYVQYDPIYNKGVDVTPQDKLSGYASKDTPLEFLNGKIEVEGPDPTPGTVDFTIGLNKTYDGLTLTNLGDDTAIQTFLNGTAFELIEVDENGQPAAGATAITLNPRWDGSNAVVSRKITIAEGVIKYYRISETKASDGFEQSGDVYIWKIVCDVDGGVSAEYKVGDGSYMPYTAGGSYPAVENARSPFSGTISLIKTYEDLNLAGMDVAERTTFLNGTTFALYNSPSDGVAAIATTHPVWENGQAVVKFDLGSNITVSSTGIVYYIRETEASTGYVKSDVVYECKISNVNGRYEVGYRAGSSGDYTSAITCNNAKQTFEIASVTIGISKTFDNPTGLSAAQMTRLISDTKFTFYTDAATTKVTNDFVLQPNPVNNSGTVDYIYNYTRTLNPGDSYTYYVKETATNTSIYTMDTTVYKIEITVGQPTPGVANDKITPSVTRTNMDTGNIVDRLTFTNTRIPKAQSPTTITFTKVFENNFSNVDADKINGIISATRFTLYDAQNNVVTGFSQPTTSGPDADGNVTYTYSLVTSSLDVNNTYYYYLKETNTNQNYYQLNNTTYAVRIVIDADGKPTVSYAEAPSGSSLGSLDYKENLEITNQQTPADSEKVLNSTVIEFTKEFDGFENYIDDSDIVTVTTFTLTSVNGSAPIGFTRLAPQMTGTGAIYSYQLDLSNYKVGEYTGGTYTIKESRTDGRYTTSNDVLTFEITVSDDGEATWTFTGGNTIRNELKPEDPQPNTPTTPSTPNTPSTPPTPSTPSTPSTPPTPSTPSTPPSPGKVRFEILIEYEHIDSSSKPERIEELTTNTTIKIVDKDGNDVTENVTKITWDPSRNVAVVTVEVPKPSEGFDTYYVVESTDPADNDLSHSEPGKGFTVAVTSDGRVLFQEDGSATPTTELRFVNVEGATDTITNTTTSMTSPQTGERKLPWTVFGGGMSMIFIAGVVYVFKKKEKIEE